MKKTKIKIYRMPLSRVFPATHPRAGEPTYFKMRIERGIGICDTLGPYKIHTIRAINPESKLKNWIEKIDEVQEGKAVLVLYEWNGKPYSKDGCTNLFVFGTSATKDFINELLKTEKYKDAVAVIDSGIGTQKLDFAGDVRVPRIWVSENEAKAGRPHELSHNDGLSLEDFYAWFKGYDLSKPFAAIHFTKFRY